MNVDFGNSDSFVWQTKLSHSNKVPLKIIDNIEGNINLNIMLADDSANRNSYTRYHVIDLHNAEILITNAESNRYTRTEQPIKIGTYKNDYLLYLEYVLEPEMSNQQSILRLKFFIKRK